MENRAVRLEQRLSTLNSDESMETAVVEDSLTPAPASEGMCVECGDQPFTLLCITCSDSFCDVCFQGTHRSGTRRSHKTQPHISPLSSALPATLKVPVPIGGSSTTSSSIMASENNPGDEIGVAKDIAVGSYDISERCKYIPLRLAYEERRMLRLVEAALNVSEYTDKVDIQGALHSRTKRMHEQLKSVFSILCGLMVAEDFEAGKKLIEEKEADGAAHFFQTAFEIARRYKILNPERMRADYGKLLYMLQDSRLSEVKELTEIECVRPIKTVFTFLASRGEKALALLRDPLVEVATRNVLAGGRQRWEIDAEIKRKEAAQEKLAAKYSFGAAPRQKRHTSVWYRWNLFDDEEEEEEEERRGGGENGGAAPSRLTQDEIKHCLYSIGDNNTFLTENVLPVEKMLGFLEGMFAKGTGGGSLGIQAGRDGARLTHSHASQFTYVRQSLLLWRAILKDFYRYWMAAEDDFLNPSNPYRLRDTGQGLNRVQACPRVSRAMAAVLHAVWEEVGGVKNWIGSSVVHLGDNNVPNSFTFLDKYTQVSRILSPLALVVESIPKLLREHPALQEYIKVQFGTSENLVIEILRDFFRHGFDGSGADNFFDAGSCIDGRLTSAWEWCSKIDRKAYAPVFKLCSVLGFDGRWEGK